MQSFLITVVHQRMFHNNKMIATDQQTPNITNCNRKRKDESRKWRNLLLVKRNLYIRNSVWWWLECGMSNEDVGHYVYKMNQIECKQAYEMWMAIELCRASTEHPPRQQQWTQVLYKLLNGFTFDLISDHDVVQYMNSIYILQKYGSCLEPWRWYSHRPFRSM